MGLCMAGALTVASLEAPARDPARVSFALVVAAVKLFHGLSSSQINLLPRLSRIHPSMDYFHGPGRSRSHLAHAHGKIGR